jgi:hypothetical protein
LLNLLAWISVGTAFASAAVIVIDETRHPQQMWVMNIVWPVTALYFSVIAQWFYFRAGRRMTREAMRTPMHLMHGDGIVQTVRRRVSRASSTDAPLQQKREAHAPRFFCADRGQPAALLAAPFRNASRSALIVSACVVGMPCGKSL